MREETQIYSMIWNEKKGGVKMMRRIALLTILSVAFLFSFAAAAFAELPTAGTAGPAGTPANQGTGYSAGPPVVPGAGYTSPSTPAVKYDTSTNPVIHSNYSANTDACASCHATHTAVGANLLQWADTSTACMACHDGTVTSTYDVKSGKIANTAAKTSGGLFGGTSANHESHHNTTGTTSLAYGGSENNATTDKNGKWSTPFSCAACHSPHGQGGNSRILNADPNGIALQNKVTDESLTLDAGLVYKASKGNWIAGYPYSELTVIKEGTTPTTVQIYKDAAALASASGQGCTIDYRTGKVTFKTAPTNPTASYVPGIHVVMGITDKLLSTESVTYTSGVNQFCGACHTDYNTSTISGQTASGHTLTGQYRSAYRHQVGMIWDDTARGANALTSTLKFESVSGTTGKVMCLTCHYAHGTDDTFAGGTTSDTNRSTALKRQVNMSVCETCHQKGAASSY